MKRNRSLVWCGLILLIYCPAITQAAKFSSAKVTRVVNDVKLLQGTESSRPAKQGSQVSGSTAVLTGQKSRAELQFPDESLVRLGSNSVFSFSPDSRDVKVDKGTLLLQVPKSLGRTQIKTAAITAAITGTTILFEYIPPLIGKNGKIIRQGTFKIIVVEGSLEFFLNASPRRKLVLKPGEMVAFSENAKRLPKTLNFDIPRLMKTSSLFNMGGLPDIPLINREIAAQTELKKKGQLIEYGVVEKINGRGNIGSPPKEKIRRARVTINSHPVPPALPVTIRAQPSQNDGPKKSSSSPAPVPLPDRPDRDTASNGGTSGF